MEAGGPRAGSGPGSDVRLCGYLRKQKSLHRRFFVLRGGGGGGGAGGPARLEYYRNEKAFRQGGPAARPKRAVPLAGVLSVSKRPDARRHRHLLVLYGRDGTFGVAAESAEEQERWYAALVELHRKGRASLDGDGNTDSVVSGPAFKEVWQVSLRPRGLGHTKNLAGTYLLCLTEKTISFVKLNSDTAVVVLQLLSVRRCGHSENYFFMEVGRSAVTGPGELWMQVEDRSVAQNMHETILEAMKALSDEFRVRSKSQPLASAPIAVPPCPQHLSHVPSSHAAVPWRSRPDGVSALSRSPVARRLQKPDSLSDYSAISSDEGGSSPGDLRSPNTPDSLSYPGADGGLDYISMGRLALAEWGLGPEPTKRASLPLLVLEKDTLSLPRRKLILKPVAASASYPEGLNRSAEPSYMAMLPGVALGAEGQQAYIPMTPGGGSPSQESAGYMLMSPSGSCSPEGPGFRGCGSSAGDYMNMSPHSSSASSTPPEHSPRLAFPGGPPFCSLPGSFLRGARPRPPPFDPGCLSSSSPTSSESPEEPARSLCSARPPPGLIMGIPRGSRGRPGESVTTEFGSSRTPLELRATQGEVGQVAVPGSELATAPRASLGQADSHGSQCHRSEVFPDMEWSTALPWEAETEPRLNYIDLDLVKEAGAEMAPAPNPVAVPAQAGAPHTYASIDFHRLGELRAGKPSPEGTGP